MISTMKRYNFTLDAEVVRLLDAAGNRSEYLRKLLVQRRLKLHHACDTLQRHGCRSDEVLAAVEILREYLPVGAPFFGPKGHITETFLALSPRPDSVPASRWATFMERLIKGAPGTEEALLHVAEEVAAGNEGARAEVVRALAHLETRRKR